MFFIKFNPWKKREHALRAFFQSQSCTAPRYCICVAERGECKCGAGFAFVLVADADIVFETYLQTDADTCF